MINTDITQLIAANHARIASAIECGSGWEIWFQVEMAILMRGTGRNVARELPYPNTTSRLDLGVQERLPNGNVESYGIEIKVESANETAGGAFMRGIQADITKILAYPPQNGRWVIGIGYSVPAKQAMQACAGNPANHAIYHNTPTIGILVVSV